MAPWIDIAGWTLLHFVWQGAAIAFVAAPGWGSCADLRLGFGTRSQAPQW